MGVQGHPQLHSETTWAMLYGQSICKYILSLGLISRSMGQEAEGLQILADEDVYTYRYSFQLQKATFQKC